MEELFSNLAGAKFFTVFDLKDVYFQHAVDPKNNNILIINTHTGSFKVLRLAFGVKYTLGICQRKTANIFMLVM